MIKNIVIRNLSLQKKGNIILEDISLKLLPGVSYLLYGRNGAGKSSLLKCLVGLDNAFTGDIYFNDPKSKNPAGIFTRIYLPENLNIPAQIKVGDYIESFVKIYKEQNRYRYTLHKELKECFKIEKFDSKYFGELSKGMKKLVFISTVLISDSDLIVLDEPFEGLDLIRKEEVVNILLQQTDEDRIVVLTSHEIARMNTKFDCLISIKEGNVTQIRNKHEKPSYEEMLTFI